VISILIADDQALLRGGLRMILEAQGDLVVVAEAADGAEAVRLVAEHAPDVVLMDIRMPGVDGIEATRRIASDPSNAAQVLVLTTFDQDDYVYEALRAGAAGFLLKSAPPARVVEAVRVVAAGDALLAPPITRRLIERYLNRASSGAEAQRVREVLTARELEVFEQIAAGKSNAEIAGLLFLSEATVKTHVNRILQKLELRDRVQVVVLAYETGLVEPGSSATPSGG
jgi:DNA-binding NarL/FixJ family response regulator